MNLFVMNWTTKYTKGYLLLTSFGIPESHDETFKYFLQPMHRKAESTNVLLSHKGGVKYKS